MSTVAKDVYTSVLSKTSNVINSHKIIKKLMMRAVGQRDMSIQKVMHQLLSVKLVSSSFQVISTSLDGSRKLTVQSNSLHTEKSLLDLYAKPDSCECDFARISNLKFIQFAPSFCKGNLGTTRRNTDVEVKTHPHYSSNPKGPSYGLFCKYQLLDTNFGFTLFILRGVTKTIVIRFILKNGMNFSPHLK